MVGFGHTVDYLATPGIRHCGDIFGDLVLVLLIDRRGRFVFKSIALLNQILVEGVQVGFGLEIEHRYTRVVRGFYHSGYRLP